MEAIEGNPELMGNAIIELLQSAVHIDVESQKTLDEKILAFEVVYGINLLSEYSMCL